MLHNRQAPGRDFHKHFSLAPARSDTITASSTASATAATRNPPPHPDPYKTGPQARKATSRAPHLSLMPLSLPCPKQQSKRDRATRTANSKASATQQTTQQPQRAPPHLKPRMGTDGEGRRNPARLCTTAVRCAVSTPSADRADPKGARRAASQAIENPPYQLCHHLPSSSPGTTLRPGRCTNSPLYVRAPPPP